MRRRRSIFLTILILVAAVGLSLGVLTVLFKQEPEFYTAPSDGEDDDLTAVAVLTRFGDLKNDIRSKPDWGATFTGEELNAFLRANLADGETLASILPEGLSSPRVSIDGDRVKIAARYRHAGSEFFSTVVVIELKIWLVSQQLNTVAVEFCKVTAGAVPIGSQSQLDKITEAAKDSNIDVMWYRHDGNPVGLFRFYADQSRPTTHIRTVSVGDGRVTVGGKSLIDPTVGPVVAKP